MLFSSPGLWGFIMAPLGNEWTSLVAQMAKNLPAVHETWVQSLGQNDPLEKEMATHSTIFACPASLYHFFPSSWVLISPPWS